jgi:hypothetical protein
MQFLSLDYIIETNWSILFREIIAIYTDMYTKHINTLCVQNAEFPNVKAGGNYSNHCVLKREIITRSVP